MSAVTQIHRITTETQVTTRLSQELVQTMLSASIGCIAYLRGIFPDDTFFEERYNANTVRSGPQKQPSRLEGGQRVMRLQRNASPGAAELLDYLV
ncbi:protein of unknown function [Taphrina deformans PYCC 5710]|uniref:HORMA domain-containing protein n=1 Tax=Taphrina deformans (strain PYCC 5710 / ATCC 11124 / CBS 356.35 / IMI 108563 / JCM 9778 / NBRC 8474) TaxID=1097556 RepID=R4XC39_TAPDE|nr:protein of unknown function [Taphrina deformans PYCC 5710]|eukprot:CCG83442.1 protein of unknown function [Taphrina deformans PYCC 5710]